MQKLIDLVLEGDELYPKVDRNTQASDSEGYQEQRIKEAGGKASIKISSSHSRASRDKEP